MKSDGQGNPRPKRNARRQSTPRSDLDRPGMSHEELSVLGQRAADALGNPILQAAFQTVLHDIWMRFLSSKESEDDQRKTLYLKAQLLKDLEGVLVSVLEQATADQERLAQEREANSRLYSDTQGYGLDDLPGFEPLN